MVYKELDPELTITVYCPNCKRPITGEILCYAWDKRLKKNLPVVECPHCDEFVIKVI